MTKWQNTWAKKRNADASDFSFIFKEEMKFVGINVQPDVATRTLSINRQQTRSFLGLTEETVAQLSYHC